MDQRRSDSTGYSLEAMNGASVARSHGTSYDIETPPAPWSHAVAISSDDLGRDCTCVDVRVQVDLEVLTGSVGLFGESLSSSSVIGREVVQGPTSETETITLDVDATASRIIIRNGPDGSARLRLHRVRAFKRLAFDVTEFIDELMPIMLLAPGRRALEAIATALSARERRQISPDEMGALTCRRRTVVLPFDRMWTDAVGRIVAGETNHLTALLSTYDPTKMDPRNGYLGRDFFASYLRQSTTRVYHLIEQLRARGVLSGSILEIGSLFGQFALPLRRLGCDVTVVDRYRTFDGALDGYTEYLRNAGVSVIATDRSDEADLIARLGEFDAVICMAVIEHIPNTPRELVRMLASHVRPGGTLALDTPNIARYWNRKRLARGLSIHQPIDSQFYCDVPYEGHHREYTSAEMVWILEQVGCREIAATLFDYNLLQFSELTAEHIEALLAITVDPTLADIVLVVGTVGSDARSVS